MAPTTGDGGQDTGAPGGEGGTSDALVTAARPKFSREQLEQALAGTFDALAAVVTAGIKDAPGLGEDRADDLAALWAPVLEPYIDESSAKWLPVLVAAGGTARVAAPWVREVRAAQAKAAGAKA